MVCTLHFLLLVITLVFSLLLMDLYSFIRPVISRIFMFLGSCENLGKVYQATREVEIKRGNYWRFSLGSQWNFYVFVSII